MASYKSRLAADLDRWVAGGLVPPENRAAILATVPDPRRLDSSATLALLGTVLLGLSVVAFVAANWNGIPRIARFGLLIGLLVAAGAGGALAARQARPHATNALLSFAALVFAASIGLTGQIFDLAGDPRTALYTASVGAVLLGLAGRSAGAVLLSVVLFVAGDVVGADAKTIPLSLPAGAIAVWLSPRWSARSLAHAGAIATIVGLAHGLSWIEGADPRQLLMLALAATSGGLAVAAQRITSPPQRGILVGWMVVGAMFFFIMTGLFGADGPDRIVHRLAWLCGGAGLIVAGRSLGHAVMTGTGVVGLLIAVGTILMDLGLDLLTASALFGLGALLVLAVGWWLRRRAKAVP